MCISYESLVPMLQLLDVQAHTVYGKTFKGKTFVVFMVLAVFYSITNVFP